jgi:hypothetical protein
VPVPDIAGLIGVAMILVAYAGGALGRLRVDAAPALIMNLVGALLIVWSLLGAFNLSAFVMEAAWAFVALAGLIKLALQKRS